MFGHQLLETTSHGSPLRLEVVRAPWSAQHVEALAQHTAIPLPHGVAVVPPSGYQQLIMDDDA